MHSSTAGGSKIHPYSTVCDTSSGSLNYVSRILELETGLVTKSKTIFLAAIDEVELTSSKRAIPSLLKKTETNETVVALQTQTASGADLDQNVKCAKWSL